MRRHRCGQSRMLTGTLWLVCALIDIDGGQRLGLDDRGDGGIDCGGCRR